mgnify:CR=1 FL=1
MFSNQSKHDQLNLVHQETEGNPDKNYYWNEPNPYLESFINDNCSLNNNDYNVKAINGIITGNKNDQLYMLHTYWSKKPFNAINTYIEHFTKKGDLVLDCFLGCGSTAVVSMLAERIAVGIDISPSAMKIANGYCNDHPFSELQNIRADLISKIWAEVGWLFTIGDTFIRSIIVSESFRCIKCYKEMPLASLGIEDQSNECPYCSEKINTRTLEYMNNSGSPFIVEFQKKPLSARSSGCFNVGDSNKYNKLLTDLYLKIDKCDESDLPEDKPIPQKLIDLGGRLFSSGTIKVSQLYSKRQRLILSGIRRVIYNIKCSNRARRSLEFVFSSILLNSSQMYRVRKSGGGGVAGAYYVPPIRKEIDIIRYFVEKYDSLLNCQINYRSNYKNKALLSCQSAADMSSIKSNSIDYIFTDPPYADTMPYAALNCVYDYWFSNDDAYTNFEAIGTNWDNVIKLFFIEAFRVLKEGHWLSLCYHDTSEGTWGKVQDYAAEAGFIPDHSNSTVGIDSSQKAYQQSVADKVTKRDLIINFRKPFSYEIGAAISISGDEDQETFSDKVRSIIRDTLSKSPGLTKDRIYDDVVCRMVRAGKMESHNFDELLLQVAEAANGSTGLRWYLKDSSLDIIDAAESSKEDAVADKISRFVSNCLNDNPESDGVHYSDVFEHYVFTVKDKPRRHLAEWILDYLFITDDGKYRLPTSEDEIKLKSDGRVKGTQRRIKRYISFLQQGISIIGKERPNDLTLAEWIRHCKRSGLYEQGKLLYEKGGINLDNLSEETMVNVEEDYQVCVRMLARSSSIATAEKLKRGRKSTNQ